MIDHPPICPKTPETFRMDRGECEVWPAQGSSAEPIRYLMADDMDRRFIARYQACAWQDRGERWWNIRERSRFQKHHERLRDVCCEQIDVCELRAMEWRHWEAVR